MRDVIFCKAYKADVRKTSRCPDYDCNTCPEIKHNFKKSESDIAEIYLSNPQNLPSPLHYPIDEVVTEDLKNYLPKTLEELKVKYSDNEIKQISGALLKFQIAAIRYCFFITLNRHRKTIFDKKKEKAIEALQALTHSHYRTEHFGAVLNELENDKPVPFTPSAALKHFWPIAPPVKMPVGMKGNLFYKALLKVIYKLLDRESNKGMTEALTARVINDFSKNSRHSIFKFIKDFKNINLTAKHINNALHS